MGGGVERMMVYLANNFVSRGIKVDYIVIKNHGPYKKLLSENVNLIDLKKKRVLFAVFALAKYLRKNRPEVLLSAMNYVNLIAYFSNLISYTKTRLVISERSITSERLTNNISGFLFKKAIKSIYPKTYRIITISNDVKFDLVENFNISAEKITTIYNMVSTNNILHSSYNKKNEIYDSCFNDKKYSSQIIVGVGRLVQYKNFKYLINAFALVQPNIPNSKLLILGEGIDRIDLENLIKKLNLNDKVKLLGFVDNIQDFLQISTLFVSTSLHEGFGNVIIEAMAAGLPVIVTDCKGGPKEIVDYGKYGDIVPLDDVNILALKITERLNKGFDKTISINRAKDFSIEKISQEYLSVLLDE